MSYIEAITWTKPVMPRIFIRINTLSSKKYGWSWHQHLEWISWFSDISHQQDWTHRGCSQRIIRRQSCSWAVLVKQIWRVFEGIQSLFWCRLSSCRCNVYFTISTSLLCSSTLISASSISQPQFPSTALFPQFSLMDEVKNLLSQLKTASSKDSGDQIITQMKVSSDFALYHLVHSCQWIHANLTLNILIPSFSR